MESQGHEVRVLVVDDDEVSRTLVREALEIDGFQVMEAADGAAGLAAFTASAPDVVLLDLEMPGMNGLTLSRRMRALPGGHHLPIVMVTAAGDVESVNRAYEAGATDFITKPIRWPVLGHRLRYLLRSSRAVQELEAHRARLREMYENQQRIAEELAQRNLELDSFVYCSFHDLRTPLVTIDGMAQLVAEDYGALLGDAGRHYIQRIRASVRHLEHLVAGLTALSEIGRDTGRPEHVWLDLVVDVVLDELAETIQARRVVVTRGTLGTVEAVPSHIEQVFRRLLANAVKYVSDAPTPTVEIGAVDRGDHVECWVRDNGIGVDPAYHGRIFQVFERLKEVEAEGAGVGLAIVKKIVEGVGGRVWVESSKGHGATFRFTWPAGEHAARTRADARDRRRLFDRSADT
jgi:signal transduction histidine kinase